MPLFFCSFPSSPKLGSISIPVIAQLSNPLEKSCSIHPRRLTPSDSLEERIVIAKSSIVASTIPKSQIYHGNRDAYPKTQYFLFLDKCSKMGQKER